MRCRGLHEFANTAYVSRFLFSGLLRVAPYCVPDGIRVVSIAPLLSGRGVHPKLVQLLLRHASITIALDRYSHWIPSTRRHAAEGTDKALG